MEYICGRKGNTPIFCEARPACAGPVQQSLDSQAVVKFEGSTFVVLDIQPCVNGIYKHYNRHLCMVYHVGNTNFSWKVYRVVVFRLNF